MEPLEALQQLREGNDRFVSEEPGRLGRTAGIHSRELAGGQSPIATVLGCSDSRVPVEIVFDQDLGDLFVIRVAGNIAAPSQIGSVEFAAEAFGTRLVVVLGHSGCGAIAATIEQLGKREPARSPNLRSIVDRVSPAVQTLLETDLARDQEALRKAAVRANVRSTANLLRHGSEIIERAVEAGELLIVGAEYSLETGAVDFFDVPHGTSL